MASLSLTLAALATSAVPGLEAVAVRPHHPEGTEYSAAILTTEDDEVIISVPRTQQAERTHSASVLAISALTDGARSTLDFAVPRILGLTRAGDTRAVASTFLPGFHFDTSDLTPDALLIASIAESVSAIHRLPHSIVHQGGLPDRSAQDQRLAVTRVVDRAAATRKVPQTVLSRWTEVLEAADIWDFEPRVVHGTLSGDTILTENDKIIGVLDWSGLAVGDPATDLAWLLEAGPGVFEAVTSRYLEEGHSGDAQALRSRALLYHELELANWLLHGVDTHDEEIIADAVSMLDRLVDRLSLLQAPLVLREQMSEAEAIDLLGHTPVLPEPQNEAAASEALDEDRMFSEDTDFVEPLTAADVDAAEAETARSNAARSDAAPPRTEEADGDAAAEKRTREVIAAQPTQPISDADLPIPSRDAESNDGSR